MTYFTAMSNLVPYAFVWEKSKIVDFSETIVVYDLKVATDDHEKGCIKSDFKEIFFKLATNDRSDKMFLLTSTFRRKTGLSAPVPGLYTCIKS